MTALFDGPARAIRAALELRGHAGAEARVGLDTGEIERTGTTARGGALHLAARVCAEAQPGEVLVTETTRDLVEGSGLRFAERGEGTLSGERPRRLYAALAT
jgi:class 3 adenylate cyclase